MSISEELCLSQPEKTLRAKVGYRLPNQPAEIWDFPSDEHLRPPSDFVHNSIFMFEKLVKKELGYSVPKRTVTIAP